MIPLDHLRDILFYFARFVDKDSVAKCFQQPEVTRLPGYDELVAELALLPQDRVIPDLNNLILSINEKYLSDRMKNMEGGILFIEYGAVDLDKKTIVSELNTTLAISIATDFSICNGDVIQEFCVQQNNLRILNTILDTMRNDERLPDWCDGKLIEGKVSLTPIPPASFYGKGGWQAIFNQQKPVI